LLNGNGEGHTYQQILPDYHKGISSKLLHLVKTHIHYNCWADSKTRY